MKNIIKLILLLIYVIGIFFIENYYLLGIISLLNILIILIKKIDIKKTIANIVKLIPFILFTAFINYLFADLKFALLITIRLILVCNITFVFSQTITYMEFAQVMETILYPLKIFRINPKDISLIITIALSFMPIMKEELLQMKNVLKIKGINPTKINVIKNISLIFKPFFISVMQRVNEIELSLKEKAYI